MKTLLNLVLSAFILVSMVPAVSANQHQHAQHESADYACPMHPEVTGKQGDTCPKCGMYLAADKSATSKHQGEKCDSCPNHGAQVHKDMHADTHACPMNPKITGKEGDSCPKCGMDLAPIKTATNEAGKHAAHHKQ